MSGAREKKKQKTKAAILKAALRLFSKKGYDNTSISELAAAAGIGKGTIYSYFTGKSDILLSFCEEQLQYVEQELIATTDSETTLLHQLLAFFMGEFRFISRNREFGRIMLRETVFPKELTVERSMELDNKYLDRLVPLFKKAQERGELRTDIELIMVTGHIYGLYIMTVSGWYMQRLLTEDDVYMAMEALFLQALQGLAPNNAQEASDHERGAA